ncbi:MAG: response regulator transcription factor [Flavobacteriaceae bacterium]|nr:response regulator transcription factor [Flavobacteriaceae bacterium]
MSNPIKILLAEDEPSLGQIIKESLETRNFKVDLCINGQLALDQYHRNLPDILVLDVMMPLKDGFTVAKEIRKIDAQIPIIFLTAKSQVKDVVHGFNIGGNDYLKKPFSMEELIVRIQALLTRKPSIEKTLQLGEYQFDNTKQTLTYNHISQELTHRESDLLYHLYQSKNKVLERGYILNKLWGNDDFFNARSMDVFISKLRKKLQKDEKIKILNIRGVGYKLII